MIEKNQVHI